jgi:hypothetical protein
MVTSNGGSVILSTNMDTVTIGAGCTFNTDTFGSRPYTGAVVLSPGPGIPMGLSAAAACSCCRGDQRAYLIFTKGVLTEAGVVSGRTAEKFATPSITLLKTENTYYKVSYLPGETSVGGCCKCLTNAYELNIPLTSKATNWCDLHTTLKPKGTTARAMDALIKEVTKLKAENARYRSRLGLAAAGTEGAPETAAEKETAAIVADVLASVRDCGCD